MEVVEESVVQGLTEEMLINVNDGTACISSAADEISKPNGVAETGAMANSDLVEVAETTIQDQIQVDSTTDHMHVPVDTNKVSGPMYIETVVSTEPSAETVLSTTEADNHLNIENQAEMIGNIPELASKIPEEISELFVGHSEEIIEEIIPQAEGSIPETIVESSDQVTFKTEILVERNENDTNELDKNEGQADELDASKNMLSALSDELHSDNMENNNGSVRQEVLNKEELLNILEGNVEQADDQFIKTIPDDHKTVKTIEAQLALQQLTRLKSARTYKKNVDRTPRRKKTEKRLSQNSSDAKSYKEDASADENEINPDEPKIKKVTKVSSTSSKTSDALASDSKTKQKDKKISEEKQGSLSADTKNKKPRQTSDSETTINEPKSAEAKSKRNRKTVDIILKHSESSTDSKVKKENHCASATTNNMEVDDQDIKTEATKSNSVKDNIVNDLVRDWEDDEPTKDDADEKLLEESEGLIKSTEALATAVETVAESDRADGSSIDSSTSDGTAANKTTDDGQPQRRLGRVIKKKVIFDPDNPDTFTKGKLPVKAKEVQSDKEQPAPKKIKTEVQQRPKSKSPTGKLHWKKPPPKASKTNKRLSEVDKLLMDEGAVNMIYQLTPEAPKGKKNMRTKAEFIKKIQSSTPEGKEMKFRERKKECIKEEGEAKKIAGGKQRGSLSSSVKSVGEDFETHSADDSIIYRRHSSSSYSSNCMSPLRINDQDSIALQDASRISRQISDSQHLSIEESVEQISEVFISDTNMASPSEVINKSDCLSIKQKLNSKLQNVLNKRKRDNTKTDKPAKQKRITPKLDEKMSFKKEEEHQLSKLKNLTVKFDHSLAEINVKRKGDQYTIETLKDLELALAYVNNKEDIAITLLSSECGTLCSSMDLSPLLIEDVEIRTNNAVCFAETIRSLLSTVAQHSKLLCAGVSGACSGVGLALAALADVAVAAELASFRLDAGLLLGGATLGAHSRLPKSTVDNLVVFGRRLSAEEALQGGLVSRVVWPHRFPDTLRGIAKDIAKQNSKTILMKKQLLTINRSQKTFQSSLELERDLLADYWTSEEGMEALRASLDTA